METLGAKTVKLLHHNSQLPEQACRNQMPLVAVTDPLSRGVRQDEMRTPLSTPVVSALTDAKFRESRDTAGIAATAATECGGGARA